MAPLGANFPWVSSGQSWGALEQPMELQADALLPGGPLHPSGSGSSMRRGFSAEALPRHFGMQQVLPLKNLLSEKRQEAVLSFIDTHK